MLNAFIGVSHASRNSHFDDEKLADADYKKDRTGKLCKHIFWGY